MPTHQAERANRTWLTGLLGAYILMQFGWWAYLLIQQHHTIDALAGSSTATRYTLMILGEGSVFLGLLSWGFVAIWKGIKKERAQARKERHFLLAVTHELKTPIAGTQLAIDSLKRHEWDEETKKDLYQDASAGLARLSQRVENILQSNRLVSGKAMNREPFDAENLLKDVIQRQKTGPYRDREITLDAPSEPMGLVQGDADAIALAWGNIIENALKYSPNNEPVHVVLSQQMDAIQCSVNDGGKGIPANMRKVVLEKFERIEHTDTTGTGLGLYLAHQIIRMHGGQLTIAASKRGGCHIATELPLTS
jgi:K+-sensing histidine kinase KdpD